MSCITELRGKKIVVLGAGLTGLSCVRYLHAHNLACVVNDSRDIPFDSDTFLGQTFQQTYPLATLITGYWCQQSIEQADIILASPGIDLAASGINQWVHCDCEVMGDVELFCRINNNAIDPLPMLAVTGSNGKSTVVSLLAYLANALGMKANLAGNIGTPVLDLLSTNTQQAKQTDMLIVELSSFQLETLKSMRAMAASVLNLSDDHLDRHMTMANYQAIKQSIYPQAAIAVVNRDDMATATLDTNQRVISFGSNPAQAGHFGVAGVAGKQQLMFGDKSLIALDTLPLAGMHNALNYLAVLALGYSAGWPLSEMIKHLAGFSGLEHRCQRVDTTDNIIWINDSKATNVGATLAAINGLASTQAKCSQLILIAGGEGKGADFTPLRESLNKQVNHLITLGKDGAELAKLAPSTAVETMQQAVSKAKALARKGDIVLLSPACASIDMYANYMARGNEFMALAKANHGEDL